MSSIDSRPSIPEVRSVIKFLSVEGANVHKIHQKIMRDIV